MESIPDGMRRGKNLCSHKAQTVTVTRDLLPHTHTQLLARILRINCVRINRFLDLSCTHRIVWAHEGESDENGYDVTDVEEGERMIRPQVQTGTERPSLSSLLI